MECSLDNTLAHTAPIAFPVNEMYNAMGVYQGTLTAGQPGFTQLTTFNKYDYLPDLSLQFQWNPRQSQDVVSPVTYKPVFTRLNFNMSVKFGGPGPMGKVRVTYLMFKNPLESSDKINVNLPGTLGAYRNLAIKADDQWKNAFNPRFHKIVYDRWITFPNPCRADGEKANVNRYISIPYKYQDQDVLTPDYNQHPTGQVFWTNIPLRQQVWCIISCNQEITASVNSLALSKLDTWRDHHGKKG